MVRSINLRKKALPGTTTEQAKLSRPVNDWISLSVTFLRVRKSEIKPTHLSMFSRGNRASKETECNSIPANDNVVPGPQILSGAMDQEMNIGQGIDLTEPGIRNETGR